MERNGDLTTPMDGREVWHIAKSVSKWTWRSFDIEASDARFSALQAHRGAMGGKVGGSAGGKKGMLSRWGDNEDKQASARLMAAKGMSTRTIAAELGVSQKTASRWTSSK